MEFNISPKQQYSKHGMWPDIENDDWKEITLWLTTEFQSKKLDFPFLEATVHKLLRILFHITGKFTWYNCLEAPVAHTLTETLKAFRLYVTNEKVAAYLTAEPSFYEIFHLLIECIFTKKNGPELYTKYSLQLFLNLLSAGSEDQKKHSRHRIRDSVLINHFRGLFHNGYGYFYEASAVLYNVYYDIEIEDEQLIVQILQCHANKDKTNEYLEFLIEKLISGSFVWKNYERILPSSRLGLLNFLQDMCIQDVEQLPDACLKCLITIFNECSSIVFQVTQQGDNTAIKEVSFTLKIIAHLSSEEKYLKLLQNDKDILVTAGVLLINIHRLGKASNNVFTPVQKLAELQNPSEDVQRNPVFGFKADLVRLIGNFCWKNTMMQDLARESELIPVLLDCCNIDAKNLFIMQWVILAIRNICENNKQNQAVIGSLTQQGVVNSAVLQEFGLTLHTEEDLSVGIIQLDINKQVFD